MQVEAADVGTGGRGGDAAAVRRGRRRRGNRDELRSAGRAASGRRAASPSRRDAVGVLVLANFGATRHLRVDGVPVGRLLGERQRPREATAGSCIAVVATDAPLQRRRSSSGSRAAPASGSRASARSPTTAAARSSSRSRPSPGRRRSLERGRRARPALRGHRRGDRGGSAERALGRPRRRRAARDGSCARSPTTRCSSCCASEERCDEGAGGRDGRRRRRGRGGRAATGLLRTHDVRRPRPGATGRRSSPGSTTGRFAAAAVDASDHGARSRLLARRDADVVAERVRPALQPADLRRPPSRRAAPTSTWR